MYTQELLEDDPDRRNKFFEVRMNKNNGCPDFMNKILFSDKSTFCFTQKSDVCTVILNIIIIRTFLIYGKLTSQKYFQTPRRQCTLNTRVETVTGRVDRTR